MKLLITAKAEADLEAIADYIALDNPARARSFIEEIGQRCESICKAPRAAPIYEEMAGELRRVPFGNYLIFYKLEDDIIYIVRVLHGSRDVPAVLEG